TETAWQPKLAAARPAPFRRSSLRCSPLLQSGGGGGYSRPGWLAFAPVARNGVIDQFLKIILDQRRAQASVLENGQHLGSLEARLEPKIGHVYAASSQHLPPSAPRHQIEQGPHSRKE